MRVSGFCPKYAMGDNHGFYCSSCGENLVRPEWYGTKDGDWMMNELKGKSVEEGIALIEKMRTK